MTLEDETGIANTIVWPRKFERYRPIVHGRAADQRDRRAAEREGRHPHRRRPFRGSDAAAAPAVGRRYLIDPSAPNDETKRPVQGSWRHPRKTLMPIDAALAENHNRSRHPRSGDTFVQMTKEKPAIRAACRRPARRQGAAEGTEFSLRHCFRSSPRKRGPRVQAKDWIPACAGMSGGESMLNARSRSPRASPDHPAAGCRARRHACPAAAG